MKHRIVRLTKNRFNEAVEVVLRAELDTREEIEHHLKHLGAHLIALDKNKIIGVVGWYHDTVNWATEAMGNKFPGTDAYWLGFFVVEKKHRGKGIGFALLNKLESELKRKSTTKLWVTSVPETTNYYKRQNFKYFMKAIIHGRPRDILVKDL